MQTQRQVSCEAAPLGVEDDMSARALGRVVLVTRDGYGAELVGSVQERNGRVVRTTASVTAGLRAAVIPSEADSVVVAFAGVDRFSDDWAGPRLVTRVRERTAALVIAAVPAGDIDGATFAIGAGAHAVIEQRTGRETASSGELPAGIATSPRAPFEAWFTGRFGAPWSPWMAVAVASLALGSDRSTQAEWCRRHWGGATPASARRRLRELRALLTGEVQEEFALERRAALQVLRRLGRCEPVVAWPPTPRSLAQAAQVARDRPDLISGLVSPTELEDLFAIAEVEQYLAAQTASGPGRPPSGAWRARRDHAIGRVASLRATTALEKLAVSQHLTIQVQETVLLIHDALDDECLGEG